MAETDLRADSARHNLPIASAPPIAVMRVLSRLDRPKLEAFVAVAIDILDEIDHDGDEQDVAYIEWTNLNQRQRAKPNVAYGGEDDEQDDFDEDSHDQEAIDEREPEDGE